MNCNESLSLMHEYLDGDLAGPEAAELKKHLLVCAGCRTALKQFERTEALVRSMPRMNAPDDMTDRIMRALPKPKRRSTWTHWIRRHPAVSVASVFFLVMLGSFMSLWNDDKDLMVKGNDLQNIVIQGDYVYVPAGQTVHGNLLVQNGHIQVDGNVDGNLVVIDGSYNLASTAHIAGKIVPVDRAISWFWYKVNEWISLAAG